MKSGLKFIFGLVLGLIILSAVFLAGLSFGKLVNFAPEQNKTQTQIIIDKLKALKKLEVLQSNLFAYKSYESGALFSFNKDQFTVFETGKAIYGLDLSKNISLKERGKKIELNLPEVQIFDLVINPDSISYVGLKKGFLTSQQDFEEVKAKVMIDLYQELKSKSNNIEVLQEAQKNSENLISSMLKSLGYETVVIHFGNKEQVEK